MSATSERHIVVLTGAGISQESGLDTFRDADGICAQARLAAAAPPGPAAGQAAPLSAPDTGAATPRPGPGRPCSTGFARTAAR